MGDDVVRRDFPWSKKPIGMRVSGMLFVLSCIAMVGSILLLGAIETAALKQPTEPGGMYQHAYLIKGVIRYLTDAQVRIQQVVSPLLVVFGVLSVLSALGYETLRRRDCNRRKQTFLDHVSDG
jgi:hypothetical protein